MNAHLLFNSHLRLVPLLLYTTNFIQGKNTKPSHDTATLKYIFIKHASILTLPWQKQMSNSISPGPKYFFNTILHKNYACKHTDNIKLLTLRPNTWTAWGACPFGGIYTKKKKRIGSIIRYHNHKPQTNPWHRKEEPRALGLARLIEISVNRSIYKRKTIIDMKIQKSVTFNVCSVYLFN